MGQWRPGGVVVTLGFERVLFLIREEGKGCVYWGVRIGYFLK